MADTPDTPTTPTAKPATRRRAPRATATKTPAKKPVAPKAETAPAPKRAATPKPRSTKRATPAPKRRTPAKSTTEAVIEKTGGKWGAAAIAGGVAAIGAVATAALLSLRSSTPKPKGAHTADGKDASESFEAGIADEGTIPDKI